MTIPTCAVVTILEIGCIAAGMKVFSSGANKLSQTLTFVDQIFVVLNSAVVEMNTRGQLAMHKLPYDAYKKLKNYDKVLPLKI